MTMFSSSIKGTLHYGNISAQLAVYLHSANLIMIDMTVSIKKRNFKCTTCKKEFLTKREIERHIRREQNELLV
jgi:hypothetical protein